mmetsp:Transcript_33033/g.48504  ORF Transcript_33033/g.48504 Transcript_33033/m.48504 type:complete len:419 (+) Transcript_33033:2131-3387(+)
MAKLSEVKFTFATQKVLYTFEERLEQLKRYREDHGHIVVPRFAKGYGQGLGKWVQQQRVKYKLNKKGNYTTLTPERQQKLEEIGMVWSILKPAQHRAERQPWDIRYEQFLEFKRENGHTIVPQHYPELGNWVNQQRVHYKLMKQGRESLMTPEKALKLADAGFVFQVKGRKNKTPLDEYPQPQPKQPPSPSSSKNDEPKEKQQLKKSSTSSSSPPPSTASPSNSTSSPLSSSSSSKMTSTVGGLPHHHLVIPQLAQQPHTAAAAVAAAEERQKLSALKEELQSRQAATATPTSAFLHQPHHGLTPHQQQQLSQLHQLQQQQQQQQQQTHLSFQMSLNPHVTFPFATNTTTMAAMATNGLVSGDSNGNSIMRGGGWSDVTSTSSSSQQMASIEQQQNQQQQHLSMTQFDPIEFSRMNGV